MDRIRRVARVIDAERWPDAAAEDLAYWIRRPPEERVQFGRALLVDAYRRVHGRPLPKMSRRGRIYRPGS